MERGSSKHSPRVDEQLAHETFDLTHGAGVPSRSRDDHQVEPLDDEVVAALPHDGWDERAELARVLAPLHWPAGTDEVQAAARSGAAAVHVIDRLAALPTDGRFETVQAVWEATGGEVEHR